LFCSLKSTLIINLQFSQDISSPGKKQKRNEQSSESVLYEPSTISDDSLHSLTSGNLLTKSTPENARKQVSVPKQLVWEDTGNSPLTSNDNSDILSRA